MRTLAVLMLFVAFSSFKQKENKQVQLTFERMEFVCFLKGVVNQNIWEGVTDKRYDLPLLYYTDSSSYVVNPTAKFMARFKPELVYESKKVKIYKTLTRIDSDPFHMATGIDMDDTSSYMYKSPFLKCSSLELARNYIPDILSTEQWATIILHEYFHGFQFNHATFLNQTNAINISEDSLQRIYLHNKWYSQGIEEENTALLKALASKNNAETMANIRTFFALRDKRRIAAKDALKMDVKPYELVYEEMEGTARYIEFGLYNYFKTGSPYFPLNRDDTSYHSYNYYKGNYTIETKDAWMYQTNQASYFYAIGFNMTRLLDKLHVVYKSRLFTKPNLYLEDLLRLEVVSR
jgi:hypothetical protein